MMVSTGTKPNKELILSFQILSLLIIAHCRQNIFADVDQQMVNFPCYFYEYCLVFVYEYRERKNIMLCYKIEYDLDDS